MATGILPLRLRSWIPWGVFALGLLLFNWVLYSRLQPRVPLPATPLPFWESFDGPDLAEWTALSGKFALRDGTLSFLQAPVLLRAPVSLAFQQNYQLHLQITLNPDDRAEIIFNAQYPDHVARSHYLRFHRGDRLELSSGYADGAGVTHETVKTEIAETNLRLTLEVGPKTYRLRLGKRYLFPEQILRYRGGVIYLQGSGTPAFDDLQIESWRFIPLSQAEQGQIKEDRTEDNRLLFGAKLEGSLDEAWSAIKGDWKYQSDSLVQTDAQGFDRVILERSHVFKQFRYRVQFQHLLGVGAGLVFNAQDPSRKANAQLVRFGEDGKVVFWGFWDQAERFRGQGFAPVSLPGKEVHVLEVVSKSQTYDVLLDGKYLAKEVKLQFPQGHIGLSTSQSSAAFSDIRVESLESVYQPSVQTGSAQLRLGSYSLAAPSGRWVQVGQSLRQEDAAPEEFWAVGTEVLKLKKLRANLWLEGSPDSAAGISLRLQPGVLEGTLALRLTDGGSVVVWGDYQQGEFRAKGSQPVEPSKVYTLGLERHDTDLILSLNGKPLGKLPAPAQGYLSLSSLGGPALFSLLELETQ